MSLDLSSGSDISFIFVFIQGLLSFFSPCVIPLIPIYMSYLAGNAKVTSAEGVITYKRKKVFLHTLFFVMGISFVFFLLGMSVTALGSFFKTNQTIFTKTGGIIIILLGLVQVGFLDFKFLQKERKLHFNFGNRTMNPLIAFVMGFTFSFAWTPCVGPALSSVLILASSSKSTFIGNLLVLIYSAGFVIPFLLLGLFTTQVLSFLKNHQRLLKYTVKAGGILLILIGIMTFTGWMNGVSAYLNRYVPQAEQQTEPDSKETPSQDIPAAPTDIPSKESDSSAGDDEASTDKKVVPAYDFTLTDQYGTEHTLSEYKGKVVFLNFWATWCPPCKAELPDIEALYEDYGKNEDDVIVLGITNPASLAYPNNSDVSKDEIIDFLDDNHYTFPVLFDETGDILSNYYISAFPTTFLIDEEGNVFGYVASMLSRDMMDSAIEQTIDSLK